MHGTRRWTDNISGRGTIKVEPLEWLALEFLCFNMRAIDASEIYGNLPTDNPLELAALMHQAVARCGCGYIGRLDGRPALAMMVFEQWPGNWQIASFGTQDYVRVLV